MERRRTVATAVALAPRRAGSCARVSVVIPCYNYARYLPEAVGSVLSQTGVEVDVIVVDDCSTDDSAGVAAGLAAADDRVRVLVNESNRGPVDTFNRGLAQVTGDFLVRLDADDLLTPGSLERAVAVMQHLPNVGLVYGHPLHFTGDTRPSPRSRSASWLVWRGREWLATRCASGTNVITSPEVVMRRSVVDVVGGQRPLAHTHDMEMWLRIASCSDVAYIAGADQAWHRDHPASLSLQAADPLVILGEIRDAFDLLFAEGAVPEGEPLRSDARRAVATQALDQAARSIDRGRRDDHVERLLAFARDCDPSIEQSARWRRLAPTRSRALAALSGPFARLGRRFRTDGANRRWHRTGVYEPITIVRV
jgi:glycosyltransferase involved in cell wall biosynthesis